MSATNIRPPIGIASNDNEFRVLKFTGGDAANTTNHAVNALPDFWQGKWVTMYVTGANLHYAISKNSSAEVDRAVAATAAGASAKVGGVLPNGQTTMFRLPYGGPSGSLPIHFARESDAAGSVVYMWLSDEPGVTKVP